ncbi:MAG TPA: AI-2E family transporter [Longimicrobiales bacterium]|nr:AI-2E family transporter [Longimicrobiales bacterium]
MEDERAAQAADVARGGPITIGFVARAVLLTIVLWGLAHAFWLGRDVFFLAFLAALVALFLSTFVEPLERRGVPRPVAAVLVLVMVLAVLGLLVFLSLPTLAGQLGFIQRELPDAVVRINATLRAWWSRLSGTLGPGNDQLASELRHRLSSELVSLVSGALPLVNTVAGVFIGLVTLLFAGIYLAVEPSTYVEGLVRLVPRSSRRRLRGALEEAGETLRHWMVGAVIGMALIGVMTGIGVWLLGVPAPYALGLIAGILEFIPIYGPILSAVPAILLALTVSLSKALWVVVLYIGIQHAESSLIAPLIMKRAVELPPALMILFQALMAILFGFLGLLLAVPFLSAVIVLVRRLYVEPEADRS